MAGWLKVSIDLYAKEIKELSDKRALSENELSWLEAQLSSTNREISKYLHGILQSRLMAHALTLEDKSQDNVESVEKILDELEEIMAKPMDAFLEQVVDLATELSKMTSKWEGFIEVSLEELTITSDKATEPTLQLLQEALSNAFRHGGATKARIQIIDSQTSRLVMIEDNGQLKQGNAGLGTEILTSLTQGQWHIEKLDGGSKLTATINISG